MIDVVCALICEAGRVLIVQHGPLSHSPGKWEFPGGKIHDGETGEIALIREIMEELEIDIEPVSKLNPVIYDYTGKTIRLIPYLCSIKSGEIVLREHCAYLWISPEDAGKTDLLEADRLLLEETYNQHMLTSRLRDF